jgi:hypothetical protein
MAIYLYRLLIARKAHLQNRAEVRVKRDPDHDVVDAINGQYASLCVAGIRFDTESSANQHLGR